MDTRSFGPIPNVCFVHAMKLITFECDMTAPLGTPVEPDVNMMYAGDVPVTVGD